MSDMKNEVMHGPIGSPFNACRGDVSPSDGGGVKGGVDFEPFSQWKQAGSELPIQVGSDVAYSTSGQLETPMDEAGAGIPGATGSAGTGPKSGGSVASPYVSPWGLKG